MAQHSGGPQSFVGNQERAAQGGDGNDVGYWEHGQQEYHLHARERNARSGGRVLSISALDDRTARANEEAYMREGIPQYRQRYRSASPGVPMMRAERERSATVTAPQTAQAQPHHGQLAQQPHRVSQPSLRRTVTKRLVEQQARSRSASVDRGTHFEDHATVPVKREDSATPDPTMTSKRESVTPNPFHDVHTPTQNPPRIPSRPPASPAAYAQRPTTRSQTSRFRSASVSEGGDSPTPKPSKKDAHSASALKISNEALGNAAALAQIRIQGHSTPELRRSASPAYLSKAEASLPQFKKIKDVAARSSVSPLVERQPSNVPEPQKGEVKREATSDTPQAELREEQQHVAHGLFEGGQQSEAKITPSAGPESLSKAEAIGKAVHCSHGRPVLLSSSSPVRHAPPGSPASPPPSKEAPADADVTRQSVHESIARVKVENEDNQQKMGPISSQRKAPIYISSTSPFKDENPMAVDESADFTDEPVEAAQSPPRIDPTLEELPEKKSGRLFQPRSSSTDGSARNPLGRTSTDGEIEALLVTKKQKSASPDFRCGTDWKSSAFNPNSPPAAVQDDHPSEYQNPVESADIPTPSSEAEGTFEIAPASPVPDDPQVHELEQAQHVPLSPLSSSSPSYVGDNDKYLLSPHFAPGSPGYGTQVTVTYDLMEDRPPRSSPPRRDTPSLSPRSLYRLECNPGYAFACGSRDASLSPMVLPASAAQMHREESTSPLPWDCQHPTQAFEEQPNAEPIQPIQNTEDSLQPENTAVLVSMQNPDVAHPKAEAVQDEEDKAGVVAATAVPVELSKPSAQSEEKPSLMRRSSRHAPPKAISTMRPTEATVPTTVKIQASSAPQREATSAGAGQDDTLKEQRDQANRPAANVPRQSNLVRPHWTKDSAVKGIMSNSPVPKEQRRLPEAASLTQNRPQTRPEPPSQVPVAPAAPTENEGSSGSYPVPQDLAAFLPSWLQDILNASKARAAFFERYPGGFERLPSPSPHAPSYIHPADFRLPAPATVPSLAAENAQNEEAYNMTCPRCQDCGSTAIANLDYYGQCDIANPPAREAASFPQASSAFQAKQWQLHEEKLRREDSESSSEPPSEEDEDEDESTREKPLQSRISEPAVNRLREQFTFTRPVQLPLLTRGRHTPPEPFPGPLQKKVRFGSPEKGDKRSPRKSVSTAHAESRMVPEKLVKIGRPTVSKAVEQIMHAKPKQGARHVLTLNDLPSARKSGKQSKLQLNANMASLPPFRASATAGVPSRLPGQAQLKALGPAARLFPPSYLNATEASVKAYTRTQSVCGPSRISEAGKTPAPVHTRQGPQSGALVVRNMPARQVTPQTEPERHAEKAAVPRQPPAQAWKVQGAKWATKSPIQVTTPIEKDDSESANDSHADEYEHVNVVDAHHNNLRRKPAAEPPQPKVRQATRATKAMVPANASPVKKRKATAMVEGGIEAPQQPTRKRGRTEGGQHRGTVDSAFDENDKTQASQRSSTTVAVKARARRANPAPPPAQPLAIHAGSIDRARANPVPSPAQQLARYASSTDCKATGHQAQQNTIGGSTAQPQTVAKGSARGKVAPMPMPIPTQTQTRKIAEVSQVQPKKRAALPLHYREETEDYEAYFDDDEEDEELMQASTSHPKAVVKDTVQQYQRNAPARYKAQAQPVTSGKNVQLRARGPTKASPRRSSVDYGQSDCRSGEDAASESESSVSSEEEAPAPTRKQPARARAGTATTKKVAKPVQQKKAQQPPKPKARSAANRRGKARVKASEDDVEEIEEADAIDEQEDVPTKKGRARGKATTATTGKTKATVRGRGRGKGK